MAIIRDATGRCFASFVVQTTGEALPPVESEIGIDLGLTRFAVLSDGTKVAAPKFLRRAARKLKRRPRPAGTSDGIRRSRRRCNR
ncbi:hypothetical protein [Actinoplanes philippinensis]|uniref:hypothetical protein n=1 Tax=Actinoplanes philippinensis TaxID=35752 RepID=UPI0033C10CBB